MVYQPLQMVNETWLEKYKTRQRQYQETLDNEGTSRNLIFALTTVMFLLLIAVWLYIIGTFILRFLTADF